MELGFELLVAVSALNLEYCAFFFSLRVLLHHIFLFEKLLEQRLVVDSVFLLIDMGLVLMSFRGTALDVGLRIENTLSFVLALGTMHHAVSVAVNGLFHFVQFLI